jgi:hypothetical protein
MPGLPERAIAAVEQILQAATDVEATIRTIRANHKSWREHWALKRPGQFIPMLHKWFEADEWKRHLCAPVRKEAWYERADRKEQEAEDAAEREEERAEAAQRQQDEQRERWKREGGYVPTAADEAETEKAFREACQRSRRKDQELKHELVKDAIRRITPKSVGSAGSVAGISGTASEAAGDGQNLAAVGGQ